MPQYTRAERSANARKQLRDRYGRWIEMGGKIKFLAHGIERVGDVLGFDGDYVITSYNSNGKDVKVRVHRTRATSVAAKADLDAPSLKGDNAKSKASIPRDVADKAKPRTDIGNKSNNANKEIKSVDDLEKLPVGTDLRVGQSYWTKQENGNWRNVDTGAEHPSSHFARDINKPDFIAVGKKRPEGGKRGEWAKGDKVLEPEQLDSMPDGTVVSRGLGYLIKDNGEWYSASGEGSNWKKDSDQKQPRNLMTRAVIDGWVGVEYVPDGNNKNDQNNENNAPDLSPERRTELDKQIADAIDEEKFLKDVGASQAEIRAARKKREALERERDGVQKEAPKAEVPAAPENVPEAAGDGTEIGAEDIPDLQDGDRIRLAGPGLDGEIKDFERRDGKWVGVDSNGNEVEVTDAEMNQYLDRVDPTDIRLNPEKKTSTPDQPSDVPDGVNPDAGIPNDEELMSWERELLDAMEKDGVDINGGEDAPVMNQTPRTGFAEDVNFDFKWDSEGGRRQPNVPRDEMQPVKLNENEDLKSPRVDVAQEEAQRTNQWAVIETHDGYKARVALDEDGKIVAALNDPEGKSLGFVYEDDEVGVMLNMNRAIRAHRNLQENNKGIKAAHEAEQKKQEQARNLKAGNGPTIGAIEALPEGSVISYNDSSGEEQRFIKRDGAWDQIMGNDNLKGVTTPELFGEDPNVQPDVTVDAKILREGHGKSINMKAVPDSKTIQPGEIGVDENGRKYVHDASGIRVFKGDKVKSRTDGLEGEVVTIEGNGKYVKVKGEDGKIRGRKLSTLDKLPPADLKTEDSIPPEVIAVRDEQSRKAGANFKKVDGGVELGDNVDVSEFIANGYNWEGILDAFDEGKGFNIKRADGYNVRMTNENNKMSILYTITDSKGDFVDQFDDALPDFNAQQIDRAINEHKNMPGPEVKEPSRLDIANFEDFRKKFHTGDRVTVESRGGTLIYEKQDNGRWKHIDPNGNGGGFGEFDDLAFQDLIAEGKVREVIDSKRPKITGADVKNLPHRSIVDIQDTNGHRLVAIMTMKGDGFTVLLDNGKPVKREDARILSSDSLARLADQGRVRVRNPIEKLNNRDVTQIPEKKDVQKVDAPRLAAGVVGVDANGRQYVSAPDGRPIYIGSKVKSTRDNFGGEVVTIEKNGRYVRVRGADGKVRGRAISTLSVYDPDPNELAKDKLPKREPLSGRGVQDSAALQKKYVDIYNSKDFVVTKAPPQGVMGITDFITLGDGSKVVRKRIQGRHMGGRAQDEFDSEVLAGQLANRLGIKEFWAAEVTNHEGLNGKTLIMPRVGSVMASRGGGFHTYKNHEYARHIAILDYLISNGDRHENNWMVDPQTGTPYPIDHGGSNWDRPAWDDSPFVRYWLPRAGEQPWGGGRGAREGKRYTKAEIDRYISGLTSMQSMFKERGRMSWYESALERLEELRKTAI